MKKTEVLEKMKCLLVKSDYDCFFPIWIELFMAVI